jgi:hypothetical protein
MRSKFAVAALALALVAAASGAIANPVGIKPISGGPPITLGLIPPAGAHGAFYYRVDNAP